MQPEFSRTVLLEDIGKSPFSQTIEANADERAALAKRLNVDDIQLFKADVHLEWTSAKVLLLSADFEAKVQQTCVRTLDKLTQTLKGHVEEEFTTDPLPFQEEEMDLEALMSQPEPIEGDSLDVGEILSQHLSLDLNPYLAGEESEPVEHVEEKSKSPWDKLKDLL